MAKAAITAATENLRNTVDEIRGILTEERAANAGIGRTELADKLLKFGSLYPKIKTEFTAENTEGVTPDIWRCLSDNLTEALTNLIKHSDATAFSVSIHCDPWLVKAVFADNGTANTHKKGTGLAGMEERAAFCGGRCFFRTDHGFTITMVFTIGAKEDVST
jgi:signal transduction histidine kinase